MYLSPGGESAIGELWRADVLDVWFGRHKDRSNCYYLSLQDSSRRATPETKLERTAGHLRGINLGKTKPMVALNASTSPRSHHRTEGVGYARVGAWSSKRAGPALALITLQATLQGLEKTCFFRWRLGKLLREGLFKIWPK